MRSVCSAFTLVVRRNTIQWSHANSEEKKPPQMSKNNSRREKGREPLRKTPSSASKIALPWAASKTSSAPSRPRCTRCAAAARATKLRQSAPRSLWSPSTRSLLSRRSSNPEGECLRRIVVKSCGEKRLALQGCGAFLLTLIPSLFDQNSYDAGADEEDEPAEAKFSDDEEEKAYLRDQKRGAPATTSSVRRPLIQTCCLTSSHACLFPF